MSAQVPTQPEPEGAWQDDDVDQLEANAETNGVEVEE